MNEPVIAEERQALHVKRVHKDGIRMKDCLLGLLVMLAVANLAQFLSVDGRASNRYKAFHIYNTADVMALGLRESPRHRELFGLAMAMAELAPGSRVIIPERGLYTRNDLRARLYGFGKVERIEHRNYNERKLLADMEVGEYVVFSWKGSEREPPASIAMKSESAREFILLRRGGREQLLLDTELIPDRIREGLFE